MSDLKPCPFCGEVPTIKNKSENLALFVCRGEVCYGSGMWTCFLREDQDKAIAAWNARTPDPAVQALVEALELADAALSGANMDMKHVWRKIKSALALAAFDKTD